MVQDDENQTAYLKLPEGFWWYWYGSDIEANAYYLKLLSKTNPHDVRASRLVKYLLNNRKHATYWNSTRDSAIAIEALAEYLKASGEDKPDMTVEVWLDGKKHKEVAINKDNLFSFDNKLVLVGNAPDQNATVLEPNCYKTVQTSADGVHWAATAANECWVPNRYHIVLSHQNKIWLLSKDFAQGNVFSTTLD